MVYESDIVVVGCGIAGMCVAVSAAQAGASVRVLERAPRNERGGNSRYTTGDIRMKSLTEMGDDVVEQLVYTASTYVHHSFNTDTLKPYDEWPAVLRAYGFADPELVTAFVEGAPESVAWLKTCGVRLEPVIHRASGHASLESIGGGLEAIERLSAIAEKLDVTFHYETAARSLNVDAKGAVSGVRAWSKQGFMDFSAKAVVLASGGFQGNLEMMTRYFGANAYRLRTACRGGMYNKGEGITMALKIGAAPAGSYEDFLSLICDPRSAHSESIKNWNYGILVNMRGERFVDEGSGARIKICDQVARAILAQPEGKAYFIYDTKAQGAGDFSRQIGSEFPPIKANSIEGLATALGIDSRVLKSTVQKFNVAVQDGQFVSNKLDGKHTAGITPPKSNWARTLDGPEFMAYPLVCTNVFTLGGLRVNPRAQVVNTEGYEIPGLYAAGEVVGLYHGLYLPGTSYLRGIVFGRIAGEHAAGKS